MKPADIFSLAFNNLCQNKFRTALTTLGVVIGIGSLSSMVSFGTGLSKNIAGSLGKNDIFTGLTVSSGNIDLDNFSISNTSNLINNIKPIPVDNKCLERIKKMPEVEIAFPETVIPAVINFKGASTDINIKAVPAAMGKFKPFSEIKYGKFFLTDNENCIIISKTVLRRLGIIIKEDAADYYNFPDFNKFKIIPADSIVGKKIEIITTVFDQDKVGLTTDGTLPVKKQSSFVPVKGIVDANSFSAGMFSGGVFMPSSTCDELPSINVNNIYNFLNNANYDGSTVYNSIHVRVKEFNDLETVRNEIEKQGLQVFSIGEKLKSIENLFLILDSLLAAIGTIALMISALGIINTLMMAIYERRKEIGIMKSLGATRNQIRSIFYIEAVIIGLLGGIFGVIAGMGVSELANSAANNHINTPQGVDLFSFSWQPALAAVLFSITISFIASLYPASKAAKIDPMDSLRHE